jgi:DNA-binding transcriptional LysR family regulator
MNNRTDLDKIDVHLVRVLHTLILERSVSRAALRLGSTQPLVSAQLRRLRALTGDPLLVRAGTGMTPTSHAQTLLIPAGRLLQEAERLFGAPARERSFDPATSTIRFRIAASDYVDPLFLPALVAHLQRLAPYSQLELLPLTARYHYRQALASGEVDLVIGNWLRPPDELHLGRLLTDEVVCLVSKAHPAARSPRGWTVGQYLAAKHVAPTPLHPQAPGVIDEQLELMGLSRTVSVRTAHFGHIPSMVADSLLVLTTGRLFCSRFTETLPVRIVRCPVNLPAMNYYQLWHDLTHAAPAHRWLREQVREVARRQTGRGAAASAPA